MGDDNIREPSQGQWEEALTQSRGYWFKLASLAKVYRRTGLLRESTNPKYMLQAVPRIREVPRETSILNLGSSLAPSLAIEGERDCGIADEKITEAQFLQIGISNPTPFNYLGWNFCSWIGAAGQESERHNYMAVLTPGWCYILSARLVDGYKTGASMQHTDSRVANWEEFSDCDKFFKVDARIDIPNAEEDVARWTAAILAPAQGWGGLLTPRRSNKKEQSQEAVFLTPWSVTTADAAVIAVRAPGTVLRTSDARPISSLRAFHAVAEFAMQYNLGDQFLIAFTTALTFPTHSLAGTTAHLPPSTRRSLSRPIVRLKPAPPAWEAVYEDLRYYMTLSCDPDSIMSSLCGMFWKPDVPDSLASAWLHPIVKELPDEPGIRSESGCFEELLVIICSLRRPTIWLGATTSGLTMPVLREVASATPPLDLVACAWTGAFQSFMDTPGTGPYLDDRPQPTISQADVLRLIHIVPAEGNDGQDGQHSRPPLCPWTPSGRISKDASPQVIKHSTCNRHHQCCQRWIWAREIPPTSDRGHRSPTVPNIIPIQPEELQSISALNPPQKPLVGKAEGPLSDSPMFDSVNGPLPS
ncbi:uncharacterized protein BJX67DRAFT_377277 [Aspergillus lucknowensis]|uniref:Uncharacterized protein n=1 Tax=Aspergillus lucknowensis TaxID=176173 RepID=A0ABR4M4I2_9EURO